MSDAASTSDQKLWIYGASSHGLVIAESAIAAGWQVMGFLDDHASPGSTHMALRVEKPGSIKPSADSQLIIAIGDNATRQQIQSQMITAGWAMANIIHPQAWVSPSATLGQGIYVGPMAVINSQANVEDGVIVNSASVVEHHAQLEAFCHICPRAAMAGHVRIGSLTLLGTGAAVRPRISIGRRCIIGAGAAVVCDIPDDITATGVPARVVQRVI